MFIEDECPHKALGWESFEYIGKTKSSYCLKDVSIIDVNAATDERIEAGTAYIETLKMLAIAGHNITYTLFAYVLLSFANRLIKGYRKQGNQYFINIYGKSTFLTYKSICKYFADFSADTMYNNYLSNKHSINFKTIKLKKLFELFTLVSDYPIIIESTDSISVLSGKGNKMLEFIQNRGLNEFPIFATDKPMNSDNIYTLNLSGSDSNQEAALSVSKNLNKYHCIMDEFVIFIKNNYVGYSNPTPKLSAKKEYYKEIIEKTIPLADRTSLDWLPFAVDLNYAFHLFIELGLEHDWIDEASAKIHTDIATKIFKEIATEKVLPPNIAYEEITLLFKDYVNNIFNSYNRYTPSYCYWETGGDTRDKTPCYYMDHKLYFQDFCKNKNLSNVDKDAFEKHLYQINWIKRRESSIKGTYPIGLKREIQKTAANIPKDKSSLTVLIIKKEYFH